MIIQFQNPSNELIGLLASLEEYLLGELIVTDAMIVEAASPRAQNILALLQDPIYTRHPSAVSDAPAVSQAPAVETPDPIDPHLDPADIAVRPLGRQDAGLHRISDLRQAVDLRVSLPSAYDDDDR